MDLNALRATRNTDFSKITAELEKVANPTSYQDDRFWKPERDKAGNASATIRFLARHPDDELPWVKIFSHSFKGPSGRWYIENCLSTLGKPDPVSELNMKLWNSTTDDNSPERKQARLQKRKLNYISNVLIVNDPKHPENNGKVFLFKYGKKIFDKIMDKARPVFEDQDPVNVFDYWAGANFKLRMKTVEGYPNYDASEFESSAPVAKTDEEILKVANAQYALSEFMSSSNFKTYDELKTKLQMVLSGESMPTATEIAEETLQPKQLKSVAAKGSVDDTEEDMMSFFQKIADDDIPF
jgi:hypothetical protein